MTRRIFVSAGILAIAGMARSRHWLPRLVYRWERAFPLHLGDSLIRSRLLEILDKVHYFLDEILRMNLPPELHLRKPEISNSVFDLKDLIKRATIVQISDPFSGVNFSVDLRSNLIFVNLRLLGALAKYLSDGLLHETIHLLPQQQKNAAADIVLMKQMGPLVRKWRLFERVLQKEAELGRPLDDWEVVNFGLWDFTGILEDAALKELLKEMLSNKFLGELEAYSVQLSLVSYRARQHNPAMSPAGYYRYLENLVIRETSWAARLLWWLGFPEPTELYVLRSMAELSTDFVEGRLTTGYLNRLIRHLLMEGEGTDYRNMIVMIYRAEKDPAFTWKSLKGDDDPATKAFFDWARLMLFKIGPEEKPHASTRPSAPVLAAA